MTVESAAIYPQDRQNNRVNLPSRGKSVAAASCFLISSFSWRTSNRGITIMGSSSEFAATAPGIAAEPRTAPAGQPFFHQILTSAIIALGIGFTAAWIFFLGYVIVTAIEFVF
jgi:hypothetical protein